MIVSTNGSRARGWRLLRLALLAVGGLLLGHDAVYAVRFGIGGQLAAAMNMSGHGYWLGFTMAAFGGLAVLAFYALARLDRLSRAVRGRTPCYGDAQPIEPQHPYLGELVSLWPPLFVLVTAGFGVQENLEHLALTGHLAGLGVLTGPDGLTLPVIAAVTAALAAIGALVRWRTAILEERLRRAGVARRWSRAAPSAPHPAWAIDSAALAARRTFLRRDEGRAPPRLATAH
jgi:hypothetical protein